MGITMAKEFDAQKFINWIKQKFQTFQGGNIRLKGTDFARYLGRPSQTVSYWLLEKISQRPDDESCKLLINKYGYEAYEPLGLEPPMEAEIEELLPGAAGEALLAAISEIRSSGMNKGKSTASPEDLSKIKEIFSKHGVSFKEIIE